MLVFKIFFSVIALICLGDLIWFVVNSTNGGGLTYSLCNPFGLYGSIGMFTGLIIRLIEAFCVGVAVVLWFI